MNTIEEQVTSQVRSQLWNHITDKIQITLSRELCDQPTPNKNEDVGDQVYERVCEQVSNQIWMQVDDLLEK